MSKNNFKFRNEDICELMDDPSCDLALLENTYRQFTYINRFLTRWRQLYLVHIRPVLVKSDKPSLLDIGFGGGDLARSIHAWAKNDGIALKITAIDDDIRALHYVQKTYDTKPDIRFANLSLNSLGSSGSRFDVVISNHVLHHLSKSELIPFLTQTRELSNTLVIHSDLERSEVAYRIFYFGNLFFKNSFIVEDGQRSIQRAFTAFELQALCGKDWSIEKQFPFRLLLKSTVK